MAVSFVSRGGARATTVFYPDVPALPVAGDTLFLTIRGSAGVSEAGWTQIASVGTTHYYYRLLDFNPASGRSVTITGTGQMVAFRGVRTSGNPWDFSTTNQVGSAQAISASVNGFEPVDAFFVVLAGRSGNGRTADTVAFTNAAGGTATHFNTATTSGAAVGGGYYDGSSATVPITGTYGWSGAGNQAAEVLVLSLTSKVPANEVSTTVATGWFTDGPPAPIVYRNRSNLFTTGSGTASLQVYYPDSAGTHAMASDVVFMAVAVLNNSNAPTIGEAGWSLAATASSGIGNRTYLYWKRLNADVAAGTNFSLTFPASVQAAAHTFAISGLVNTGDPFASATAGNAGGTGTVISLDAGAFNPNEAAFLGIIGRAGAQGNTFSFTGVSGGATIEILDGGVANTSQQTASAFIDGDGASDPVTFTGNWSAEGGGTQDPMAIVLALTGTYPIIGVNKTVSTGWDIETQVVATASTTYDVSEVTSASLSAGTWNVRSTIAPATTSVSWVVRQRTAEFTSATSWNTESGFGKIIVLPSSPVPVSNAGGNLDSPSFDVLAGQTVLVVAHMRTAQAAALTSPGITDLDLGHTFTQLGFEGGTDQLSGGRIWTKISQAKITSSGTMRVRLAGPAAVAAQGLTVFVLANVQESGGFRTPLFDSQLNSADTTTAVGLTTQGYNSRVFFGSASVGSTFATSTGGDGQRSWIYLSNAAGVVYWQQVDGEPGVAVSRTFTETVGEAMHSFVLEVTPQPAPGSLLEVTAARSAGTWNTRTAMATPATAATAWQTRSTVAAATASTAWTITALVVFKPSSTWNTTTAVHGGPGTEWRAYQNAQTTASTEWVALVSDLVSRHPTEWGVSAVLTTLVGSTWDVTRSVQSGDYSSSWGTAAGAQTTAGTDWSAYQSTTKNLTTRWNLHSAVDLHRDQAWKVFTTAQVGDYSTEWMVRAEALVLKQSGWDTRASAALTKSTVWKSFAEARALAVTEWRVTNVRFVDLTAGTQWSVESGITLTHPAAWTVRTPMQAARSTTWNDLTLSATARPDTNWKVRALAGQKASTSWATVQTLATSRSTLWDTTEMFERYSPVLWDITDSVATSTELTTWITGGSVRVRPTTLWTVHPKFVAINDIGEAIVLPSMSARVRIGGTIVTVELGAVNGRLRLKKENN